jgi:hypothetical protein
MREAEKDDLRMQDSSTNDHHNSSELYHLDIHSDLELFSKTMLSLLGC